MKMSSTTNTTDPTDGTVSTSINATSTSTDANQRDHDNQDISVEQSDKDEAFERNDDGGGKSYRSILQHYITPIAICNCKV